MFRSRRFYLSLLGVVACSTTAADTVLSILDAASLSVAQVSFVGLPIAASALDVGSLCCVGVFSLQHAWTREGIIKRPVLARHILVIFCVAISAAALVVSLVSIITIKLRTSEVTSATSRVAVSDWTGHLAAQLPIWTLACLSETILYSTPLWGKSQKSHQNPASIHEPRDSVMSEVRHSNQTANLYVLEPTQPSSPLAALPSPTFSTRSSQSLKSWRESLQHVVRPVTSRTKLINRPSFTRDSRSIHSDGQSIDNVSQSDGFDAWEIDTQARDVVMQLAPSRGTALEPIPGSRPASPARALDGPFPMEDDEADLSVLVPPPKMIPDTSRPPSPSVSEGHIHPLFRSESPTPPPPTTKGTIIHASPLADQMIACPPRPYSRMRSNSRTASPSPLMHSQSFHERAMSPQQSSRSRSSSPPSRGMTPPIPDFVLNSSPRSSMSGSQNWRKVNLQIDSGR